jgi:hypothetical protein
MKTAGYEAERIEMVCNSRRLLLPRFAEDLADAFVIKQRRRALRVDEDGDSGAKHERFRVVDLEPIAAHQLHRESPKRRAALKGAERSFEVVGRHTSIITPASTTVNPLWRLLPSESGPPL